MFFTPIVGAIFVLTVAYIVLALYVPWETFARKKVSLYCSKYVTPAIFVYILVACFGWDRLVALMPSSSTENIFIKQTAHKNTSLPSSDPNKYELLIEFGVRYSESNVDLEINVGNPWTNNIEGWWDKPHLTQKGPSSIDFNHPVTSEFLSGLSTVTTTPKNVLQDAKPPIYKLKFDGITLISEKRSLYLLFHSDKPLKLKSIKFNGKIF